MDENEREVFDKGYESAQKNLPSYDEVKIMEKEIDRLASTITEKDEVIEKLQNALNDIQDTARVALK